jgi:proteasome lid subunit RPN8/RPN11
MGEFVRIVQSVLDEISAQAARYPQIECCGLLGGRDGMITSIYPAANVLASGTAYEIAPKDLFRIMRQMRTDDVKLMGIYHSHPTGDNSPSPTDIARAFYLGAIHFIASPITCPGGRPPTSALRAFEIREGMVTELRIELMTVAHHIT